MNETPTQIDVNNLFKNIIAAESAAVASIPAGEGYAKALELILEHTHTRHGKIVVSGMGKCGHCQVGHQYVCIDGPVFNYWEAKNIQGSM